MTKKLPAHMLKEKLVYGFGKNDSDYLVVNRRTGWKCPIFIRWNSMLRRCFCPIFLAKNPTYTGTTVCDDWKSFMSFREWVITKDWKDKELDKDLIGNGRHYSPSTCVFISRAANNFLTGCKGFEEDLMQGITLVEYNRYKVRACRFGNQITVGHFGTLKEARIAWLRFKLDAAISMAQSERLPIEAWTALVHRFESSIEAALAIEVPNKNN